MKMNILHIAASCALLAGTGSAFAAPQVLKYLGRAKTDAAKAQVQNIASILDLYRLEIGSYPDEKDGLEALIDNPGDVARWNGPYIKFSSNLNSRYGEMLLTKAGPNHADACSPEDLCYLYIVYSKVKPGIAQEANKVLDGDNELGAATSGRLQWTVDADDSVALYYRALRALSPNMDF